ncbi:MAG: response regulator [Pseudomonadota bacterium]
MVVDDDDKVRRLLRNCFESEGYGVFEAGNGAEMWSVVETQSLDLITLDLNLGGENGLTLAADLRTRFDIPIIIVTGKGDVIDKVVGLEMGADDYISKPFHVREVLARARSVIRRTRPRAEGIVIRAAAGHQEASTEPTTAKSKLLCFDGWRTDPERFELVDPHGNTCALTTADFRLLMVLLENPKRVLSRDRIMDELKGGDWTPLDRTIDNQIARLRKKIEVDPANPRLIKTVRGIGYLFAADVSKEAACV